MKRLFLLFILLFPLLCGGKKLRPLVWVLDAGHGGKDQGCETKKYQEKDITLEVTKEVAALIRKHKPGIKLILTRETDEFLSLEQRCEKANKANADLFLSIHVNMVEWKPLLRGTETFFASTKGLSDAVLLSAQNRNLPRSELLAWLLQKNYYEAGRPIDRGAKPEVLYVLRHTMMPAALTEIGFLSNIDDEAYMTTRKGQKEIALCIYNALAEYYETTQGKTEKKTLAMLRNTSGRRSGLKGSSKVKLPATDNKQKTIDNSPTLEDEPEASPEMLANQDNPPLEQQWAESAQAQAAKQEKQTEEIPEAETIAEQKEVAEAQTEKPDSAITETTVEPDTTAQAIETAGKQTEQVSNPFSPSIPVYSIQIVAVSSELKPDDERLKGLYPVTFVKSGNMFKGLYGGTTDYKKARATLASIREKFPDAFIVAYLGEEPISTSQALEMTK